MLFAQNEHSYDVISVRERGKRYPEVFRSMIAPSNRDRDHRDRNDADAARARNR